MALSGAHELGACTHPGAGSGCAALAWLSPVVCTPVTCRHAWPTSSNLPDGHNVYSTCRCCCRLPPGSHHPHDCQPQLLHQRCDPARPLSQSSQTPPQPLIIDSCSLPPPASHRVLPRRHRRQPQPVQQRPCAVGQPRPQQRRGAVVCQQPRRLLYRVCQGEAVCMGQSCSWSWFHLCSAHRVTRSAHSRPAAPYGQPAHVLRSVSSPLQAYNKMGRMGATWQSYGAKLNA